MIEHPIVRIDILTQQEGEPTSCAFGASYQRVMIEDTQYIAITWPNKKRLGVQVFILEESYKRLRRTEFAPFLPNLVWLARDSENYTHGLVIRNIEGIRLSDIPETEASRFISTITRTILDLAIEISKQEIEGPPCRQTLSMRAFIDPQTFSPDNILISNDGQIYFLLCRRLDLQDLRRLELKHKTYGYIDAAYGLELGATIKEYYP
ncbi:hypothetical protein ACFLY9_01125 [Patescibacteria group bacterium]